MNIKVTHYTKEIRGTKVLDDVSLSLSSGMIYGLKGKNGSGKTMLLRAIAGLIHPTSGSVSIDGKKLERGHFTQNAGILIENPSFIGGYSAYKNLYELARIRNVISGKEVCGALASVGLDPKDRRPVRKYSLGMRQRLGLACAVMERPDLLLLDEPVNALDSEGVELAQRLFARERERGAIVVIACHDSEEVERLFDHTFYMAEGHLDQPRRHMEARRRKGMRLREGASS